VWDNPRLLNAAASLLSGLAVALLLAAGVHLLMRSPLFELREVTVIGKPAHTDREQIRRATQQAVAGANFLAVDLDALRGALERLPWVRRVELRRIWPDRLEVTLEEHVVFARWGDAGLVNTHWRTLRGAERRAAARVRRPAGAEAQVLRGYRRFAELLAPLADAPQRVTLTSRYAWQLRLASGLHVELGRDYPAEPAERRLGSLRCRLPADPRAHAAAPRVRRPALRERVCAAHPGTGRMTRDG
jgi:cell division protein FtsQ